MDQQDSYEDSDYDRDDRYGYADDGGDGVTPLAISYLAATKPWVRFLSILTFIGCGLMIIVGLAMLAVPEAGVWLAIIYIPMSLLYIFPGLFLFRYASAIGDLMVTRDPASLEEALKHQKSFWKYVGIVALVIICLYAVGFGLIVVAGVAGLSNFY